MDLNKIIEEIYDGGGGNYPAYSQPPRKDFAPMTGSKTGSYDYPYQNGGTAGDLTEPAPDGAVSWPWPLQTATTDFADSFVLLMTGISKMVQCVKQNPSLHKESKKDLIELYKKAKEALAIIKEVGMSLEKLNMAGPQPSQNPIPNTPDQRVNPSSIPSINTTIAIKVPI
jgi:hypothetical protein